MGFVREYPDVVPPGVCADVVAKLVEAGTRLPMRADADAGFAATTAALDAALVRGLQAYGRDCPTFGLVHPRVLPMGWVIDRREAAAGSGPYRAPSTIAPRPILVVHVFLNDGVGGELEFEAQPERVVPRAGGMVVHPTGFEYVVRDAPIRAPRYTASTFLTFMPMSNG